MRNGGKKEQPIQDPNSHPTRTKPERKKRKGKKRSRRKLCPINEKRMSATLKARILSAPRKDLFGVGGWKCTGAAADDGWVMNEKEG